MLSCQKAPSTLLQANQTLIIQKCRENLAIPIISTILTTDKKQQCRHLAKLPPQAAHAWLIDSKGFNVSEETKKMTEYVVYMREQNGKIERVDYAFANYPDGPVQFYVYEEQLTGFPESKVFWAAHTGPSLGIAPCIPRRDSADQADSGAANQPAGNADDPGKRLKAEPGN
jgi:hypothetical protein